MVTQEVTKSSVPQWTLGTLATLLGTQVFHVALGWAAISAGSPATAAVVLAAGTVPRVFLMFGASAGLASKFAPLRVLAGGEAVRCVAVLIAAAAVVLGGFDIPLLLVASVLVGVVESVVEPAAGGVPALIAPASEQGALQARKTVLFQGTVVFGGPIGGAAVLLGLPAALVINAALFAAAAIAFFVVRPNYAPAEAQFPMGMPPQGGGPLARSTRAALICTILVELGCPGAFIVGTLLIAQSQGWGAVGYALCTGAIGLGTIAARFAPSFARTFRASGSGLIAGCFATALCLAVLPLSTNLAVTVVIAAVMALAAAATSAATLSVLFTATAPDQMGTVMGLVMPAGAAAAPVSIVLVGVVGQFSIDWALGVCAIALGLAGLVAGFNPVLREAKPPAMPMMQGA